MRHDLLLKLTNSRSREIVFTPSCTAMFVAEWNLLTVLTFSQSPLRSACVSAQTCGDLKKTARSSEYRGGRSILSSFLRWRLLLNKKKLLLKKSLASGFILSTRLTRGKCKDVTRRRRARSILKRSSVLCSRQGLILSRPMGVVEYEVTRCSRYGYTVLRITLRYARNLNVRFGKVRKEKGFFVVSGCRVHRAIR